MTTNSIEGGGNWRLKYELRAAYQRDESAEGRCLLDDSPQRLDEHVQARRASGRRRASER